MSERHIPSIVRVADARVWVDGPYVLFSPAGIDARVELSPTQAWDFAYQIEEVFGDAATENDALSETVVTLRDCAAKLGGLR